jgi:hypothetical protein
MSTTTEDENSMRKKIELYLYDTLAAIMYAAASSLFIEYVFATKLTLPASSPCPDSKTLAWKA